MQFDQLKRREFVTFFGGAAAPRPLAHGRNVQRCRKWVTSAPVEGLGRADTLEQQAALPITNPFEMGSGSIGDAVSRIAADKDYQAQFMHAFGRAVNEQDMLSAIAAYGRWLRSIPPSTISSHERQTPSATRPNAVGNCSIPRPVATAAMEHRGHNI